MKLIRFSADAGPPAFGFVSASGRCVAFADVLDEVPGELLDMGRFLAALPGSLEPARRAFAEAAPERGHDPANCRLYAPVEPPSLLDFGLSPRHLRNSAGTLLGQRFGALTGALARRLLGRVARRAATAEAMPYYKGNHHAVIGDHDEIGRPAYTHRLDIEPELAFVVGTPGQPVAGYLVFNDGSARDVQLPEMIGTGPNRSKDFAHSKGLGPWLVTPDEVPDPLGLRVTVEVNGRPRWTGHTREYVRHPEEVAAFLATITQWPPGTVVGMGTVPDCTGLDHGDWLEPGDAIAITIEGLGTLHQRLPAY